MVKLPYQKYNYILINSLNIEHANYVPQDLLFSLGEYLKSQMHFPILPYTRDRSLREYFLAYEYYKGVTGEELEQAFYKVVKYFYNDIAKSVELAISNNTDTFNFFIDCSSVPNVNVEKVDDAFINKFISGDSSIAKKKVDFLKVLSKDESNILISEVNF